MSNEDSTERIDDVLEILANPLSRYILSVLAGIDPGVYVEAHETQSDNRQSAEESDS